MSLISVLQSLEGNTFITFCHYERNLSFDLSSKRVRFLNATHLAVLKNDQWSELRCVEGNTLIENVEMAYSW